MMGMCGLICGRIRRLAAPEVRGRMRGGGLEHAFGGAPSGSAGRVGLRSTRGVKGHLEEAGRSLLGFGFGLLLASLYGVISLFLQKQPLWFCAYSTVGVAAAAALSMGLSAGARANVMIMLPSLCSARGKNFLLFLCWSVLLSGPLANTLENGERAATGLLCGAELAANQTQELMQRAASPLFSVVDRIREISSNALAVAGRVRNLIDALTDSVRHVARILRNVFHFLVDIGDICNDKMGTPYRKCRAVFSDARADCADLLGEFNFLCDILTGFLPLCNLARVGELFCIIPAYIAGHLKKRLAAPVVAAFQRMRREFDFNLSASATFDLDANSSRSLRQVTQDIAAEVSSELQLLRTLSQPLAYISLVLLAVSLLKAVQYKRSYLGNLEFDNIYISSQFEKLDRQAASEGGVSVLPITRREAKTYITPLSPRLTSKEKRTMVVGVASVFRNMVMAALLVALDFLVFWMLDLVHHHARGDVIARAPVTVAVQVNGSGYASDIFRDMVAAFNVLQGGNVTVISAECLVAPSEPNYDACFMLGFLLGLALLVSVTSGFVQRCRRLVCASCHPERELERLRFLRQQILDQRKADGGALKRCVAQSRADAAAGGEGGGAGNGRLRALLRRLPGGVGLSDWLGLSALSCLACGERVGPGKDNMAACDVPGCPGVFCQPCFQSLGNTCVVCMRPLTFQEDSEEELRGIATSQKNGYGTCGGAALNVNVPVRDSSDDEQLRLWTAALNSPRVADADADARALMRKRIAAATRRRPSERANGGDPELSEADMAYQDQPGSDDSDGDASFHSAASRLHSSAVTVSIHAPESLQDPPAPSRVLQGPQGPRCNCVLL